MNLTRRNSAAAISRIEVLVLLATVTCLVGLIALGIKEAKGRARSICCNCNLKQIGLAFRVWEGDHSDQFPMLVSITNGGAMELIATGQVFSSFQVASNELSTPRVLVCPEDSARLPAQSWSSNFNDQTISYFLCIDASETNTEMFLSGDRNLTKNGSALGHGVCEFTTNQVIGWTSGFHKNRGNIALADGSVPILSSSGLAEALQNSGASTNRFAVP
jgi:prepilin-type processing-associated H-X9-DG protein